MPAKRHSEKNLSGFLKVEMAGNKNLEITKSRLIMIIALFALTFTMLGVKLFEVIIFSSKTVEKSFLSPAVPDLQFERGDIYDRNDTLIASNLFTSSLYADPKDFIDINEVSEQISQEFPDIKKNDLITKFTSGKNFIWVKRNLTPKEKYKIYNLGQPGLYFKDEEKRIYPHGALFSHTIGYVGQDGKGLAGIEEQYNDYLISEKAKDMRINLSLDVRIQDVVHQELSMAVEKFKAMGGAGIVMDVNTGEVLASVSLPDFDPNNFSKAKSDNKFNKNTLGIYEIGSIFKAFTIAAAIDVGKVDMKKTYDVAEPIKIGGFQISDFHSEKHNLSVPEVFMYSSNIGTAKIAMDVGIKDQQKYMKNLGLLDSISIELPEKGRPMYPKDWKKINMLTIAYGHGIAVTPMHVVGAIASLVNGGFYNAPTIIKKSEQELLSGGKRVISKNTSLIMRKLFRLVVENGTGKKANVPGYLVGGKTGTADKQENGGYNTNSRISSFVGIFPMNKPKYVVFILLDEPKPIAETGGYATGGQTAAPVVGAIISRIGPILGLLPVEEDKNSIEALRIDMGGGKRLASN